MRTRDLSLVVALILAVLTLGACASTGGVPAGPSDEELVKDVILGSIQALEAKDIDTMMVNYADDFSSDQGDKAALGAFLQQAADGGFLDGMTVDTTEMAVTVAEDTAAASGVTMEGAFGILDLTFNLEKRDGTWLIVSQTQQ